jgi:hypothetical protein
MKTKLGIDLHNRFDVEVRDKTTGVLKQAAYAENIILNAGFARFLSWASFFVNIHFGTGTGTMDPTRTTLFSHLGTKAAVDEEKQLGHTYSKMIRKITLDPAEYVGQTLTEVGIAYGSTASYLVTHALLKNAEGELTSITKTALDVVTIYATFYMVMDTSNPSVAISAYDLSNVDYPNNKLVKYFTNNSVSADSIITSDFVLDTPHSGLMAHTTGTKTAIRTTDPSNNKIIYSARFEVNEGSTERKIQSFFLEGFCHYAPSITHEFIDEVIAVGDNETNTFLLFPDVSNPVIKVNDIVANGVDVVIGSLPPTEKLSVLSFVDEVYVSSSSWRLFTTTNQSISMNNLPDTTLQWKNSRSLNGLKINLVFDGGMIYGPATMYIDSSVDGTTWVNRIYLSNSTSEGAESAVLDIEWDDLYWRVRSNTNNPVVRWWMTDPEQVVSTVTFDVPPAEGDIITLSGSVPYYPKTTDYVLDIAFEIQFGQGVPQ